MSLTAGAAKKDITPKKHLFLVGYPHVPRTATGVHDRLWASALCLENHDEAIITVSVDILFVTHDRVDACRKAIEKATGVPARNIMVSATHTHSGPSTADILAWKDDPTVPPPDAEYVQFFYDSITAAAIEAYQNRKPARLAVTTADGTGVGGNRHSKDGVCDPEVGLIVVKSQADDSIMAVQLIYAMHPTVLHEDSTLVSGDFPDYTRRYIAQTCPEAVILYHTGPSGNLSPRYHVKGQTFDEAQRLGEKLGLAVTQALQGIELGDFGDAMAVTGKQAMVSLPERTFCSVAEAEILLTQAREDYERLKRENAGHGPVRTAECTVFGAEERVTLAKAQASGEADDIRRRYRPAEVQVLKIGETYLVGMRGECFIEYALEIKAKAAGKAFIVSLANGELQGYIVTPDASGYEAGLSFYEPAAGAMMVDAAVNLTHQLHG